MILLDRDGVLNRMVVDPDHGTVDSPLHPSQVEVFPWVPGALARLTRAGFGLSVVTNQPAWAKGKTTRANLEAVHRRVLEEATAEGGRILSSHLCFHRAEDRCACRKPADGLLVEALQQNPGYPPGQAWMVGDGITDIQAGQSRGLRTAFLGPLKPDICSLMDQASVSPTWWGSDLAEFASWMLDPDPVAGGPLGIKIFADGADLRSLLERAHDPRIQGFTTNPTLMRQAGVEDYEAFGRAALAEIRTKPISFEVFKDTPEEMRRQALVVAGWGENVYVKIPITNSEGRSMDDLIHELSHRGLKINVTAICTLEQVKVASRALRAGAPSVVSVFAGRVADSGRDPVPHMRTARDLCRAAGPGIELLWASPREVLNVVQANAAGVDIITLTDPILARLPLLGKDLKAFSLETVQMFKRDGEKAGYRL